MWGIRFDDGGYTRWRIGDRGGGSVGGFVGEGDIFCIIEGI